MDLINLLKQKAEYFSSKEDSGIFSIISHIEIAERHYELGKSGDDYLYNDVIYRSNQAFEGALKEAYHTITGNKTNKISAYEIERYLEKNNVLKERVLQLFTNYRTEWRNKSTHDYKLYFSEQEAFLAIVNISAFINILLDQIIEKRAYLLESKLLANRVITTNTNTEITNLLDKAIEILNSFSLEITEKVNDNVMPIIKEIEIIGFLTAFFNKMAPNIKVYPEYIISNKETNQKYRVDFLLQSKSEKLIIELKSPRNFSSNTFITGVDQVFNYLKFADIPQGILFIPPYKGDKLDFSVIEKVSDSKKYKIIQLSPSKS